MKRSFPSLSTATAKKSHLTSATAGLLSLPSATANLYTIHKTFTLTNSSIDKSKFVIHPRYTVIIRRF